MSVKTYNLKEKFQKEVIPAMKKEFGYKNDLMVPKLEKVVLNVGLGPGVNNDKFIDTAEHTLTQITGQKPVLTKAKQSIAGFKIRAGQAVGMKVTLRGVRMYDFVDKLINVALPRIRDFRGIDQKQVDGQGNLSIGFRENLAFPEIDADAVDTIHGLQVIIKTTAKDHEQGIMLYKLLGFPFRR